MADEPGGRRSKGQHGTSRTYIIDRLRREGRTDLAAAVESGRVSAYAVGCELDWMTRHARLGTGSTNQAKRRRHQLRTLMRGEFRLMDTGADGPDVSGAELLELLLGPGHQGPAFASEEEARAAWVRNRDCILAVWSTSGRRPVGWWSFDAPATLEYPGYERERSSLFTAGLLGEAEAAELIAYWRHEFERTFAPSFFVCSGPGKIFRGAAARRQHCKWLDLPRELRRKWTAEHRRRSRTIRKLETAQKKPREVTAGLQETPQ
jgi:hypothetical protein